MPTADEYARNRSYYLDYARAYNARHRRPTASVADRLWAKVEKTPGCWYWTGSRTFGGRYGGISIDGRMRPVHRVVYELLHGPVPVGLEIDHLCRNPTCVNPAHLEPVTHRENTRRGAGFAGTNAHKTHCDRHAHPLVETRFGRLCRECRAEDNRAYRRRKAAGA